MKIRFALFLLSCLCLSATHLAAQQPTTPKVIPLEPGEKWWGGAVNEGHKMPFGAAARYSLNLYGTNVGNQCAPFLVSSKGRYVWSEKPFKFEFREGSLVITEARGPIAVEKAGSTLADGFRAGSRKYFPPSGKMPDPLLFSRPQFNTWIELVYNQNQADVLKYAHAIVDNGFPPRRADDRRQLAALLWQLRVQGRAFSRSKGHDG